MSDIRKQLSDYSDKRMSYTSEPQKLCTEALKEIHALDRLNEAQAERIRELEAAGEELAESFYRMAPLGKYLYCVICKARSFSELGKFPHKPNCPTLVFEQPDTEAS